MISLLETKILMRILDEIDENTAVKLHVAA